MTSVPYPHRISTLANDNFSRSKKGLKLHFIVHINLALKSKIPQGLKKKRLVLAIDLNLIP
ncbi:hypothetical protein H1P_4440005 [Hyella patelloides LEGE 07179]|uniref:Uncharacterized protein n=1 Tax=Hyella patelloides LEGE 07179 TaxID=945734 RepID=A0A563VYC8_9CYAN|nr:hypothetical protein H1P_4440005 [Hyella patelloides LEGE 07179]